MILSELTGVKKYYRMSWYEILEELQKQGIKVIGSGKYGEVLASDKWDYVIKVTKNDPHYLSFVNYAINHPNKHFPKFVKRPIKVRAFYARPRSQQNDKLYMVKMERLQELPDQKAEFITRMLGQFIDIAYAVNYNDPHEILDYTNPKAPTELMDGTVVKGISKRKLADMYPWMISLASAWDDALSNISGHQDLHKNNFMQREDGTVVIIDPVWVGWNPWTEMREYEQSQGDYEEENSVIGPYSKKKEAEKVVAQLAAEFDDDIPF